MWFFIISVQNQQYRKCCIPTHLLCLTKKNENIQFLCIYVHNYSCACLWLSRRLCLFFHTFLRYVFFFISTRIFCSHSKSKLFFFYHQAIFEHKLTKPESTKKKKRKSNQKIGKRKNTHWKYVLQEMLLYFNFQFFLAF